MLPTFTPRADARGSLVPGRGWVPFEDGDLGATIPARFEAIASRHADHAAVDDGEVALTYAGLSARTADIAAALIATRPEPWADTDRVGLPGNVVILLDQGTDFVVSMLAVLRSGSMVVPLDPAYPEAMLQAYLEHAEATAIIAGERTMATAERIAGERPVFDVGETIRRVGDAVADPWMGPPVGRGDPATLFYTSGSTGRPKGVVDSHANVLDNVRRYVDSLAIGPGDRLSLIHGPMFSGLVSSCFSALLTGATLLPFDLRARGVDRLASWMATSGMTMLHAVPSVFRAVTQATEAYPDMRVVRLEGDLATWSDVRAFRDRFGSDVTLVNGLGATETGLTRQFFVGATAPPPGPGGLPIGYPVDGIDVSIVDDTGQAVAPGGVGEIVVAGRHLAVGYWRDEVRTHESFRMASASGGDPAIRSYRTGDLGRVDADGCLHHLGRVDAVHKVRGETVDPSILEQALLARADIRAATAVTRADEAEKVRLVAYVVAADARSLDVVELRRELASSLPPILVPSAIVVLEAIPLTSAGKVDRAALPAPERARPSLATPYAAPRDPLEERILEAWATVIDVRPIGVDDDFFDIGGDSLGATAMLLELGRAIGSELPIGLLSRAATIAELAVELRALDARGGAADADGIDGELVTLVRGDGPTIIVIHGDGGNPLFYRSIVGALGPGPTVHSLQPPDATANLRFEPISDTSRRYARRIRDVQPVGPYHIVGFCFGGVVADDVARRLVLDGEEVTTLILLSIGPLEFPTIVGRAARRRYRRNKLRARLDLVRDAVRVAGIAHGIAVAMRGALRVIGRRLYRWSAIGEGRPRVATPDPAAITAMAIAAHPAVPYPGRLTVVVGREARPPFLRDPREDLGGLATGGVEVVVLPGDAHDMLAPPVAGLLADLIRSRTDPARSERPQHPVP